MRLHKRQTMGLLGLHKRHPMGLLGLQIQAGSVRQAYLPSAQDSNNKIKATRGAARRGAKSNVTDNQEQRLEKEGKRQEWWVYFWSAPRGAREGYWHSSIHSDEAPPRTPNTPWRSPNGIGKEHSFTLPS